jgi:hypothetical protein
VTASSLVNSNGERARSLSSIRSLESALVGEAAMSLLAPSDEKYPLLPNSGGHGHGHVEFGVEPRRWYMLAVYALAAFMQGAVWMTYSSVPTPAEAYYRGLSDDDIYLLLNWGPVRIVFASGS